MLLGVGNLGRAVINHISFENHGFTLTAAFDSNPSLIGTEIRGMTVRDVAELEEYCGVNRMDAAFLCLPKNRVEQPGEILYRSGVRAFWNFSHFDLAMKYPDAIVENVHLSDSLMTLCYRMNDSRSEDKRG